MSNWTPDVIAYHFPCLDGFACAVVARMKWPDIQLWPINYGQKIPASAIAGKNLLIADFSFPAAEIERLGEACESVVILDHHATAREALADFPPTPPDHRAVEDCLRVLNTTILTHFDMNRSGAGLTWAFAFPEDAMPRVLQHVEDRDLWRHLMDGTDAICNVLQSLDFDMGGWVAAVRLGDNHAGWVDMVGQGHAIGQWRDQIVKAIVETANFRMVLDEPAPVVACPPMLASNVGAALLERYPSAPFAATYWDVPGGYRLWSLRSTPTREDVSQIAQRFGGGGHRNAAGFRSVL